MSLLNQTHMDLLLGDKLWIYNRARFFGKHYTSKVPMGHNSGNPHQ